MSQALAEREPVTGSTDSLKQANVKDVGLVTRRSRQLSTISLPNRLFLATGLVFLTTAAVPSASASTDYPYCPPGQVPEFNFGFAELKRRLGSIMGEPTSCVYGDPNGTKDNLQNTTNGLAFHRDSTNTPTFTNGYKHWALVDQDGDGNPETVEWEGESIDPPGSEPKPVSPDESLVEQPKPELINMFEHTWAGIKRRQFVPDEVRIVNGVEIRGKELADYMAHVFDLLKKSPEHDNLVKTYIKSLEMYDHPVGTGAMINDILGEGVTPAYYHINNAWDDVKFYETAISLIRQAVLTKAAIAGEKISSRYSISTEYGSDEWKTVEIKTLEASVAAHEAVVSFAEKAGVRDVFIDQEKRSLEHEKERLKALRGW